MEKVWLKHYQSGVPAEINPDTYQSIDEILTEACQKFADKPAYVNLGTSLSYRQLEEKVNAFAAYLQSELKLEKGDRIALMLPNVLQYPIAMFGALRVGLIVVNVNPLYTPRELEYVLKDAEVKAIVVLANFAHTLQQALNVCAVKHVIVTELGDCFPFPKSVLVNWIVKYIKKMVPAWKILGFIKFKSALELGKNRKFNPVVIHRTDVAYLQYTGGTTGVVKGAMLSHRNMVANLEQAHAWIKPFLKKGQEIIITALPLYHIFSLTANCLTFMKLGAKNILITNPRDMKSFIKELSKYPFTTITGVNTLFNALLNHDEFTKLDFSSLRITLGGGMSIQRAVAEKWKKVTKTTLVEAYGLTETSPAACINPLDLKEYNGSIGLPVSSTDISIRDEDGKECGFNEPGELWIKGPQVTLGYWKQEKETREALVDGWIRTGDIATVDTEGFVRIVDRKKDMILVSGFNVYPNEVEDVIAMMPEVKEVAVVGKKMESGDELVKAFIVAKDSSLTAERVRDFCRQDLTGYKVPKEVEFRTELPKSNVGKILRRVLRDS